MMMMIMAKYAYAVKGQNHWKTGIGPHYFAESGLDSFTVVRLPHSALKGSNPSVTQQQQQQHKRTETFPLVTYRSIPNYTA